MNLDAVRRSRPFAVGDLVIYAVVAVLVAAVCLAVFLPKTSAMTGVVVYYQNEPIYRYDCLSRRGTVLPCEGVQVAQEGDRVTIVTPKGVNVLTFGERVTMTEADCRTQACVRAQSPLKRGGDVLVCLPHALRVVALGDVDNEVVV